MILQEGYKKMFTEMPFTAVNLNGYQIPYYADTACFIEKILVNSTPKNKYWLTEKVPRALICYALDRERYPEDQHTLYCYIRDITTNQILHSLPVHALDDPLAGRFKPYMSYLPVTFPVGNTYLIDIRLTVNSLAQTRFSVMTAEDTDKYLFFNYTNKRGSHLGFPFTASQVPPDGFSYTVEGGIEIGALSHSIEQTTFRDQRFNPHVLSANPRQVITITVGGSKGVPEYVGKYINDILTCDTVFLNGMKIVRSGDSVPEAIVIGESNYPFVNFTVDVEVIPTEPNVFNIGTEVLYG